MSWIYWVLLAAALIFLVAVITIWIFMRRDGDSFLYRKYTTGDEYLDPYGNLVKGAKHGQ